MKQYAVSGTITFVINIDAEDVAALNAQEAIDTLVDELTDEVNLSIGDVFDAPFRDLTAGCMDEEDSDE